MKKFTSFILSRHPPMGLRPIIDGALVWEGAATCVQVPLSGIQTGRYHLTNKGKEWLYATADRCGIEHCPCHDPSRETSDMVDQRMKEHIRAVINALRSTEEGVVPKDEEGVASQQVVFVDEELPALVRALRRAARRDRRPIDRPYVVDDSVVDPSQVPDDWTSRLVQIWEEDEVLHHDPDAERLPQALVRFGHPDLGTRLAKTDYGDSGLDLYPSGWVRGWSYCGDSLYVLVREK